MLDQLVKRGVVSLEQDKGGVFYLINPPSSLKRMLDLEREKFNQSFSLKEQAVKELENTIGPYFKSANYSKDQALSVFLPISIISVLISLFANYLSDFIKLKYYLYYKIYISLENT